MTALWLNEINPNMEQWRKGADWRASKCWEKSLYLCHFVPTWNNGLESNPVLCNERPANNSLRQSMVELIFNVEIKRCEYEYFWQ